MPAPSLHRVRDSSCTLWWLVVVMENDDTQRDVVFGIFDNNATCSLCKPQLLIYLVLVEPCVIASCSHLHLQHDEPTTPSHHVLLDSAVMYMGGDWKHRHVGPALLCWARDAPWCCCCLPCPGVQGQLFHQCDWIRSASISADS